MSVARPVVFLPPVTIVSLSLAELRTVAAATCVSPSPPSSPPPVSSTGWLLSGEGSGSGSGSGSLGGGASEEAAVSLAVSYTHLTLPTIA